MKTQSLFTPAASVDNLCSIVLFRIAKFKSSEVCMSPKRTDQLSGFTSSILNVKKVIPLICLLFVSQANSGQYDNAVGHGIQFGGLVGYQLSYKESQNNLRGAVGLFGASLGYDYYLTDTFSLGVTYTASTRNATSININYTPWGYLNKGLVIGIDLAHIQGQQASGSSFFLKREKDSKNIVWLSVGYKF
jgi:hypothetical protein